MLSGHPHKCFFRLSSNQKKKKKNKAQSVPAHLLDRIGALIGQIEPSSSLYHLGSNLNQDAFDAVHGTPARLSQQIHANAAQQLRGKKKRGSKNSHLPPIVTCPERRAKRGWRTRIKGGSLGYSHGKSISSSMHSSCCPLLREKMDFLFTFCKSCNTMRREKNNYHDELPCTDRCRWADTCAHTTCTGFFCHPQSQTALRQIQSPCCQTL